MSIATLIEQNPNASDAEIASMASSVRVIDRVVNYGDIATILGSATAAAAIGVQVQTMAKPESHAGTPTEQAVAARMFWQVDNDLSNAGINLGATVTRQQIQAIASALPDSPIGQAAPALLAAAELRWTVTESDVASVRRQLQRDALANRLARLSAAALESFDLGVNITSHNLGLLWDEEVST